IPALRATLRVRPHSVQSLAGWRALVALPEAHAHRSAADILALIAASALGERAQALAAETFRLLARIEGGIHGIAPDQVEFHEIGALDSILDVCVAAALIERLAPAAIHCSPLPVCDGVVHCAHGPLATPAPAVQEMLRGVPVYGIESRGETITPTALAVLKAAGTVFGAWPAMIVEEVARAYGGRVLPGIPNGAVFAIGRRTAAPAATFSPLLP
ncbi:MAG: nickel insertion protein, partial [Gammaproteobacteria bacterium]